MTKLPLSKADGRSCVAYVWRVVVGLVLSASLSFAAASSTRSFDIPRTGAAEALKRFSDQSGAQILFSPASLAGVTTNAVKGDLLPGQALERMLAETGLIARQDAQTGAYSVRKVSADPNVQGATPNGLGVRPQPNDVGNEAAVTLSPFVVNDERDNGYQATSTLAGTRLNTPLKDLGASISVYTKNFIEDVGATGSNDLLIYATGMEAAGPGGNFSGATNDINTTEVVGEGPRFDPQQSSRTRGLASPNFTRGFFATSIAVDSYNVESTTVNRGPNAILFGVGSPAGVVDTALLRPDLRRNLNKVSVRYGNNDSLRSTVDFNRVLLDRKLAIRLAAVNDEERYNQRPAFEHKKRLYGALTFEPFRSTSVRANFETGNTRANRPIGVLPVSNVSDAWLAAGRPVFDWTYFDDPARNPNAAAQAATVADYGILMRGTRKVATVFSSPSSRTPDFAFLTYTPSTSGTQANAIRNQLFHPLVNRDRAADNIQFLDTANVFQFPGDYWTGGNVLPGQVAGLPPAGIKWQALTDYSAFDFRNRMLDQTGRQGDSFHTFNVALEQRGWRDRVGIELAYDSQRIDRRARNTFFSQGGNSQIRIDTTVTLPTGQPNPNVGRPFTHYGQTPWRNQSVERDSIRATAYLKYDFKDVGPSWSRWLGRHTVTGLYEHNTSKTLDYTYSLVSDGDVARANNINPGTDARRPYVLVYLGPSLAGNNNPLRLEPITGPELRAGATVDAPLFVRAGDASDLGRFENRPNSFFEISRGGSAQREVIKSQAAILQSYWLRDHLVTVVGWRRDEDYFARQSFNFASNRADPNNPGKVHYGLDDFSFPSLPPPNAAKEVVSYSAVLRWPQRWIRLPLGLSFFYNQSSNFTPIGGRVNGFGEPLAPPEGKTREYGVNIWTHDDKLGLRVNWFETAVQRQSFSTAAFSTARFNATLSAAEQWAVEGNKNPHLVAQSNADIELLFSALPSNFRDLYDFKVSGTAPNLAATKGTVPGAGDTTDFTAKGAEIELVYNPTRNLRLLANVASQETVSSNSLPWLRSFIARMQPVWNQLRDRPLGTYPLGWQPGDSLRGVQTLGAYVDASVLLPFATAIATEGAASAEQRKWRANVVANYTFDRGGPFGHWLKGWGVGGAVRWQDKIGIGYPTTRNADRSPNIDLANPYYAPAETNIDAWITYERKLWNDRIRWKAQLNVRNLFGDSDPIAIGIQPWGQFSSVRLPPERRWYLTNTFSF